MGVCVCAQSTETAMKFCLKLNMEFVGKWKSDLATHFIRIG